MPRSAVVTSLLAGIALALAGVTVGAQQSPAPASAVHGINRADLDTTCAACQDFYKFATGGWESANPAPPAFSRWGTFSVHQARNQAVVHEVLESAASSAKGDHPTAAIDKVGVYYATCMDSVECRKSAAGYHAGRIRKLRTDYGHCDDR